MKHDSLRESLRGPAKWLGVIASVGMFAVLVMGAAVTNTGSEQGCGRSWPLCHGKLIPQMAVSTAIEFSHRAVVGVESILIIALAVVSMYLYWSRLEIKVLAPLMVVFLFLQAGLGAWAVMYPQLAAALALHFGVSLVAFASVVLTTAVLFEVEGRDVLRDQALPAHFRAVVWALTGYSYLVVYLGAYVRHSKASLACSGWPLCNHSIVPAFTGPVAAAFTHRVAAFGLALGILGLVVWTQRMQWDRPDLYFASVLALALVILQSLAGAVVVFTHLDLFSTLAHAAMVGLMFGCLAYLCMHVLPRPTVAAGATAGARFFRPAAQREQAEF
jgi:cytochrome c oxidase assembly protein subunit 15